MTPSHARFCSLLVVVSAWLALGSAHAVTSSDPLPEHADVSGVMDAYLQRPEAAFSWEILERRAIGPTVAMLGVRLTSQTWRGLVWTHRLNIVLPTLTGDAAVDRPGHAVLLITGTGDHEAHLQAAALVAQRIGVPVAILHDTPNQPLFRERFREGRGLREDALIAQTFLEFLESGDPEWPLLLPMTKSAVAAMDALGAIARSEREREPADWPYGELDRFFVTGASKRGWTTWLTAAMDDRVIGIAPMVYDNLNLPEQIKLQFSAWGEPSLSIHDYTERGLLERFDTPRGRQVIAIVDPHAYAHRLTVPKLLLIGTNDSYWPLEAIHEYIGDLPGETHVHYVPNAGHTLGASIEALWAIAGFFDVVTGRTAALPKVVLTMNGTNAEITIEAEVGADTMKITAARLWSTGSRTRDFRRSRWSADAIAMTDGSSTWRIAVSAPALESTYGALIAEVEVEGRDGRAFRVHSPVTVRANGTPELMQEGGE